MAEMVADLTGRHEGSDTTARRRIAEAVEAGMLRAAGKRGNATLYGLPLDVAKSVAKSPPTWPGLSVKTG